MSDRKQKLLAKLGKVCSQMETIMSGQNLTLGEVELPQQADPSETPLEKLQRFKKLLNDALAQLNRGEPRICSHCRGSIPDIALDEMPWAWACAACAGKK